MKLEELDNFCKNTLQTNIEFPFFKSAGYGMIHSPLDDSLIALVMYNDHLHTIDLKYPGKLHADQKAPFVIREPGWIGLELDDARNDQIIKGILANLCSAADEKPLSATQRLNAMRELYDPAKTQGENFYRQGRFLEDGNDDYKTDVPLDDDHPHYHKMSDAQLRCYLTLRKNYRLGLYPRICNNYLFLYVNEIFNQIGVKNKHEAHNILRHLRARYRESSYRQRLTNYLWAYDAIYFNEGRLLFEKTDELSMLSDLDPLNKVTPDAFGQALARYGQIEWSSIYYRDPHAYLSELLKIWQELDRRHHFFLNYVASRDLTPFNLLDGIYFGYPVRNKRIVLGGMNLVNQKGHWYQENYQSYHKPEILRLLVNEYDAQLSGKAADNRLPSYASAAIKKHTAKVNLNENAPSIERMQQLYDPHVSREENFYRQGKYMETFTCEYDKRTRVSYFSDYHTLRNEELRSYFAWRTRLRKGHYEKVASCIHFFVNEIINGIGVRSPQEGLNVLCDLQDHFPDQYDLEIAIQHYVAVNELQDHYDLFMPKNQHAYDLDPRHLGTDEQIIAAMRGYDEDYGKKNSLYQGNEDDVDHFLVSVYKTLLKDNDFFCEYVADNGTFYFQIYPGFIYLERRRQDVTIPIGHGIVVEFKKEKKLWYYHGYKMKDEFKYLNAAFNKCIALRFGLKGGYLPVGAKPLCKRLQPLVNQYLDEHPIISHSPKLRGQQIFGLIQMKFAEIRTFQGKDRYDRLIRQAHAIEDLHLELKPRMCRPLYLIEDYNDLDDNSFLTYIYLRTLWRKEQDIVADDVYLLLYLPLYADEVINGIGVNDRTAGLKIIQNIEKANRRLDQIGRYSLVMDGLSRDYKLAHHLASGDDFAGEVKEDQKIMALDPHFTTDYHMFFEHLAKFSMTGSYYLKSSPLYKDNPEFFEKLFYQVFSTLISDEKPFFKETILAMHVRRKYKLFARLAYPEHIDHFETYVVSPIRRFEQGEDGMIYYDHYTICYSFTPLKSVIREIDASARDIMHIKRKLQHKKIPTINTQMLKQTVQDAINKLMREEKQKSEISIHFGELDKIREDAQMTTEKLITEAEMEDQETEPVLVEEHNDVQLTNDERKILDMLLAGKDPQAYVTSHHLMPSVLVDAINEKLFDEIGDNVIEFNDDQPVIIDDYIEDIEEIINRKGEASGDY